MTDKRRIFLIADPHVTVPPVYYGGVERIVDFLAEGLQTRGWDVTLACHPESTCNVKQLPLSHPKSYQQQRALNILRIAREILTGSYDLIHSFAHCDLTALFWPTSRLQIQSFQATPAMEILEKRTKLLPRKNLWFTTCGHHMVRHIQHLAPTVAVHNGVKIGQFTFQEEVDSNAPLVFLGRIEEIKGTHLAIEIAKATGRRLVIAGNRAVSAEGDQYFKERVEPHLSEQINYIGPVNDVQKNQLLGQAAAFLMPILWDEPFGIVMAEALACGTPVIGYSRGALPEIVTDGLTGACCNSVEEMIRAVAKIDQYSRRSCRAEVEARFSSEQIVSQYIDLYQKILHQNQ